MNLGHYASYWAKHLDDQPAAVFKEKILSWSALTAQSDAIAAMLQDMGVKKGDRVACMLHNSLEWVISYAAIFKAGAILVPLNPRYSEHKLQEIGVQVKCSIVIAQPALIGKLAPGKYAQQDSDDAVYLYPVNGVPMLWQRMSEVAEFADADITCVRGAIADGTPVSQTLLKRYADKGVCIRQTFGVTENSGMIAMPNEKFALEKSWACGWPLPTVELRIVNNENRDCAANDPGEILIRGQVEKLARKYAGVKRK